MFEVESQTGASFAFNDEQTWQHDLSYDGDEEIRWLGATFDLDAVRMPPSIQHTQLKSYDPPPSLQPRTHDWLWDVMKPPSCWPWNGWRGLARQNLGLSLSSLVTGKPLKTRDMAKKSIRQGKDDMGECWCEIEASILLNWHEASWERNLALVKDLSRIAPPPLPEVEN